MSALDNIGIRVEDAGGMSPQVLAIANEIAAHLTRLATDGETARIDLRSLPMAPGDYQALRDLLGTGEVSARLDALGPSDIAETAVPGVWWLVHRNDGGEVIADLIEITACPDILKTQEEDLRDGPERLRARIEQAAVEQ